jgi:hypothetical protein
VRIGFESSPFLRRKLHELKSEISLATGSDVFGFRIMKESLYLGLRMGPSFDMVRPCSGLCFQVKEGLENHV